MIINNFISGFFLLYIMSGSSGILPSTVYLLILVKHSRYSSVYKTVLTTLAADRDRSVKTV